MAEQFTVHHIGYMVKDIVKSRAVFEALGFTAQTADVVYDQDRASYFLFMDNGALCVELIQPKDETSPIWGLSRKYKNTPYHICLETPDLDRLISCLSSDREGADYSHNFLPIQPPAKAPAIAATARVAFFMNADIGMIEFVQLKMKKLETVISLVGKRAPLQKKQMDKMAGVLTDEEIAAAERTLTFFTDKMQYSVDDIAEAYLWFIDTFIDAQMNFARTGRYPHSTFAEIEDYYKDAGMMKNYVVALATTLYLFPQHLTVNRFYKNAIERARKNHTNMAPHCIKKRSKQSDTRYLEIGPGHGHLFVTAMENSDYGKYIAVDIAQSSVDTTAAYVKHCLPGKTNWSVERMDFFDFDSSEKFDAIVMGEVLEHVEQPRKFLDKIRDLANDKAFIYISTAVNAPFFDHIYYFGAVGEVEQMFADCGLKIKDKVYGTAGGVDFDKAVKKKYPIVPAYVLEKC